MKRKILMAWLLMPSMLFACSESNNVTDVSSAKDEQLTPLAADVHSYANPNEARTTAVHLDLTVDFVESELHGSARLKVERAANAKQLILDTRELKIDRVELIAESNVMLKHRLEKADPNLGSALVIDLPPGDGQSVEVEVHYSTSPGASGLQWLNKAQTAGKAHPFLFTQSQAIHARSWIPVQDTPGVRMTYTATIRVPDGLRAVMSASNETTNARPADGVYQFEMPQAIPAYLIALGVGDLVFKSMSERTGVFAEPSLVDAAAAEFSDTEKMLVISEELYGPYRWGRYDLLILPPSFPFGGMENPRLSFITPTVIAGDKSLVSLIAHELAHSWSGNLVTNATWRDLWLNEGFTSFLTTRIMEAVYGKSRADMEYFLDFQSLGEEMSELPAEDQILAIDLTGRDPDDVFSSIPYTKGQMFLGYLEKEFGRPAFDGFLRNYFDDFGFESISTDQFLAYLDQELLSKNPGTVSMEQINSWVFGGGIPDDSMVPVSNAFDKVSVMSRSWLSGAKELGTLSTDDWSVHEWLYFLNNLPANLSEGQLIELDQTFGLTQSRNNEIVHSWLKHVIRHNYRPGFERLEDYLISIGRRKLIVSLYQALAEDEAQHEFVRRVYAIARPGYHPLAQTTLDKIVP